jgi:serine/threonine protein kinase
VSDDAERWRRAGDLFDRVLDIEGDDARQRFLETECGDDALLLARVKRLLQADAEATHLERGVDGIAGAVLRESDVAARIGEHVGPYRIERLIGRGGMGEVYLARREDADFEQHVALKLMRIGAGGDEGRRRFLVERRLLAKLEHPNIARLYDGGFGDDGQPWYAMEYVDGAPLTRYCDERRMPLSARLRLFAKVCEAVDHAHRHLIVHRDLKPANLLVDARGAPRLLDFGIAKLLVSADADSGAETALMTPEYAAPEQLRGEAVSIATDVYALGAVLFELLTGRRPFADALAPREPPLASRACADGTPDLSARVEARALRSPDALRRALRGDLDRVLLTALDPAPERRYRSASALADDLLAVADGRPISLRGDRRYRVAKFVRRHRWGVAAAGVAVIALLATSAAALWQAQRAQERARTALAVKDFVAGLLQSASPEVALGEVLTVREVLDRGREQLPRQLVREPEVAVELLTLMARSYLSLGEESIAQALLDRARALEDDVGIERRADLYDARLNQAIWLGNHEAMVPEAAALRALLPRLRDSGSRVSAMVTLSDYEMAQNNASAEALATEALALAEASLPEGDARRIRALRALAGAKASLRKLDEAQALHERALALAERHLPRLHPEISEARMNLVTHYSAAHRYREAAAMARRALADSVAVYGDDSLQTVVNRLWVGRTIVNTGDLRGARPHFERALRTCEQSPTKLMVEQSAAELLLGRSHEAAGNLEQAQALYQRAVEHHLSTGRESHSLPYMRMSTARVMARRGQFAEAEELYRQVADSARPGGGVQGLALSGLGTLARLRGDPARAEALHRKAVGLLQPKQSPHFRSTLAYLLDAQLELARDQAMQGRADESRATLLAVVGALDAQFPYESPDLVDAYSELAALTASRDEAHRLLARSLALRERMHGADDPRTLAARQALTRG